jgi:ATP-dependent exoDNAse (exonuclease V) beta subunit
VELPRGKSCSHVVVSPFTLSQCPTSTLLGDGSFRSIKDLDLVDEYISNTYSDQPCVTAMTGHASKGLEWDTVYLIGFAGIPSKTTIEKAELQPQIMKQERKLQYVMMSRSRCKMYECAEPEKPSLLEQALFPADFQESALEEIQSRKAKQARVFESVADSTEQVMEQTDSQNDLEDALEVRVLGACPCCHYFVACVTSFFTPLLTLYAL